MRSNTCTIDDLPHTHHRLRRTRNMSPMCLPVLAPSTALLLGLASLAAETRSTAVPRQDWAMNVLIEQLIANTRTQSTLGSALSPFVDPQRGVTCSRVAPAIRELLGSELVNPAHIDGVAVWQLTSAGRTCARAMLLRASPDELEAVEVGCQRAHAIVVAWSKTFRASVERRSAVCAGF